MRHYYLLALIGVLLFPLTLSAQTIQDGVLSKCEGLSGRYVVPDGASDAPAIPLHTLLQFARRSLRHPQVSIAGDQLSGK